MHSNLFILPSFLVGGAEKNLFNIVKHKIEAGEKVNVIFLTNVGKDADDLWCSLNGVHIYTVDADREFKGVVKLFLAMLMHRHSCRFESYDFAMTSHTHCNAFLSILVGMKLLKVQGQIIHRESTNVFSWFKGAKLKLIKMLYYFYSNRATVVCQSTRMKSELCDALPFFKKRNVIVLRNPLDSNAIIEDSQENITDTNELNFLEKGKVILSIGRLVDEKAFDLLVEAVSLLGAEFKLAIIGEGNKRDFLLELINKKGMKDRVLLLGHKANPHKYIKYAYMTVVSSRLEGFPNVLHEKMLLSNRIVSTLCAGGVEDIPGIITCTANDLNALTMALKACIALSPKEVETNSKHMSAYLAKQTVTGYIKSLE